MTRGKKASLVILDDATKEPRRGGLTIDQLAQLVRVLAWEYEQANHKKFRCTRELITSDDLSGFPSFYSNEWGVHFE